jgi:hypothetical protein
LRIGHICFRNAWDFEQEPHPEQVAVEVLTPLNERDSMIAATDLRAVRHYEHPSTWFDRAWRWGLLIAPHADDPDRHRRQASSITRLPVANRRR